MFINPKTLSSKGKKKLKELEANTYPTEYHCLDRSEFFVSWEGYQEFLDGWRVHKVLREMFEGVMEEDDDYGGGWDLTPLEMGIYTNIAKIILNLRGRVDSVEEQATEAHSRMDRI
jgi:hypothetical protein